MRPRILLVNPPVYDFTAYDFWLKPYGMLRVAGELRGEAEMCLFDHLDRLNPLMPPLPRERKDPWGRGEFYSERVQKPAIFHDIPRYYRRFGVPREIFRAHLAQSKPYDFVLVQTCMTYWYEGVREVVEDVRSLNPAAKVVLGGPYATLCKAHAEQLGADLVVKGSELEPLWELLGVKPKAHAPALWEVYERLQAAALKLTDGCPFRCTYCAVSQLEPRFSTRPLAGAIEELELLCARGVRNIAFYDDALLFRAEEALIPFLQEVIARGLPVQFHTPNAINVRFITKEIAELMIRAGFKTFYLGLESSERAWLERTGSKLSLDEFMSAVASLKAAGGNPRWITAYLVLGHPDAPAQNIEGAMRQVHSLGIRIMLADFSPIPGTPDGERCERWTGLAEPLNHNKTAFTIRRLGWEEVNRLKRLARTLNQSLGK